MATGQGAFYEYSPTTGVVIPDTLAVRSEVEGIFKNAFGADFVTDNSTPAGVIIDSLTQLFAEQCGIIAQCANGFDINKAIGKWLDGIGNVMMIHRHPASYTSFDLSIAINAPVGETFNSGTILIRDANGNLYKNKNDVVVSSDAQYYTVKFESDEIGTIDCDLSTISIASLSSKISLFSNDVSDFSEGAEEESDMLYRNRIIKSLSRGIGYRESVVNAIMSADQFIKDVKIGKNFSCAYVEQDGIVYPPSSICIVIRNGIQHTLIEKAISDTVPFGCGFCSDIGTTAHEFAIDESTGEGYLGYWHEAEPQTVNVSVSCIAYNYPGTMEDIESDISRRITEYFDSAGIGGKITVDGAMLALSGMSGVRINNVKFNDTGTSYDYEITLPITKFASPSISTSVDYQQ